MRINIIIVILALFSCNTMIKIKNSAEYSKLNYLPDWVTHPTNKYPSARNLTGLGVSSNKKMAENDALNSIAKIFESQIRVDEQTIAQIQEEEGDRNTFLRRTNIMKNISVSTDQTLINTKIVELYYDPEAKKYYALALMEKQKTAVLIKRKIKNNTIEIIKWKNSFQRETDLLKKFKYLYQMKNLLFLSKSMGKMLALLDAADGKLDYGTNAQYLKREQEALNALLDVKIKSGKTFPRKIKATIEKELTAFGFQTSSEKREGYLIFELMYKKENMDNGDSPAKFVHWDLLVSVQYNMRIIAVFEKSGRDGHASFASAQKRAEFTISKIISNEFKPFLEKELFE